MSLQQGELDLGELRDRFAIITGAGNYGIGWGLALHAATELNMHVVLVDLYRSTIESAAKELQGLAPSRKIIPIACDVTSETDLEDILRKLDRDNVEISIGAVFANAGVIFNNTILNSSIEDWETTLSVNVMGVVKTVKTFLPRLQAQAERSIFCSTASVGGLVRGDGGAASYQASKHAVVALSESLSFEIARKSPQIHVHVLCPCIVTSSLLQSSQKNKALQKDKVEGIEVSPIRPEKTELGMSPERHAEQVFDLISAGKFYVVTDNIRPYVDHDFPFDSAEIIAERYRNMASLDLDNADAFSESGTSHPSSILKGALFKEARRKAKATQD
tara:strand:- start:692 stop:1687 length:996 start_codon:yes stop_codon:yes gene_type:complete